MKSPSSVPPTPSRYYYPPAHNVYSSKASGGKHSSKYSSVLIRSILIGAIACIVSFYCGLILGMQHTEGSNATNTSHSGADCHCPPTSASSSDASSSFFSLNNPNNNDSPRFPKGMENMFAGAARVSRDDFTQQFDLGVPLDASTPGNHEVLILYSNAKAIPNVSSTLQHEIQNTGSPPPLLSSPAEATIHCDTLKLILTEPRRNRHCMAVLGQWESYYIAKWMRLPPDNIRTGLDSSLPLRKVSRTHSNKGRTQVIPRNNIVMDYGKDILAKYLLSLPEVLERLKPIAAKAAAHADDNTLLVLVCNYGQSELLLNFVCNGKSRGFDMTRLVVFATDEETQALAEGLGVATFYDPVNFESLPREAARQYGDGKFKGMMLAKVFCVHMLSQLGYNILFQDVDVIWYQDPISYFLNPSMPHYDFDMYFQDDGAHSVRYAPYSPNTGFYFVRNNERTRYFFNCLVRLGDMIKQTGSHQAALTSVLNEHTSYRGLTVKVFSRDTDEFPGGYHYHRGKQYMKDLFAGTVQPYIFHMSWTKNKENKKLFLEQLGEWYVHQRCSGGKKAQQLKNEGHRSVEAACCLAEPLFQCHYRDKPSKKPCKDSPPIDGDHRSWW